MKVASAREPARRIAVAGTLAAAILAVPACSSGGSDQRGTASFSLGFDNSGALADAREVAARDHRVVDLPALGKGAFYEVTTALGKPALARVAGVPRRHADLLIASLNADQDSGRLPDQQAAMSWYRAVYDRL
jgi:hypothetical protein